MKKGGASKSDAFYVAKDGFVCGINPNNGGGSSINWTGNYAFSCDFSGRDITSEQVPGDQCSSKCQQTAGCTHYVWYDFDFHGVHSTSFFPL